MIGRFDIRNVKKALRTISPSIIRTPCVESPELSGKFGRPVYLKLENLQATGAFKIRGNCYKLSGMKARELASGVVTASSGNHGLGLALAAAGLSVKAKIFVPSRTPENKIEKLKRYGAAVVSGGGSYDDAVLAAKKAAENEGAVYVPSFDDEDIITGNATMALEIYEDVPGISLMVAPVGGGGGISGLALALKSLAPSAAIVGVEASGAASMLASLRAGRVTSIDRADTIADGIAVRKPGELTFPLVRALAGGVETVSEPEIKNAVSLLARSAKIIAEPAGAAAVAALGKIASRGGEGPAVCLVSGGNIDAGLLSSLLAGKD